ncbi:MAG TPA: hypothetical protein VFV37_03835, partial [Luteibaculaceae bacterium]|nr:hypothetical protein [Luteibaculaceae bacterium]
MRKFSVFSIISLLCVLATVSLRAQDYRLGDPPTSDPAKPALPVIAAGNVVTLCGDTLFSFTDGGGGANGDGSNTATNYGNNINQSLEFVSSLGNSGVIEVVFTDFFTSPGDVLEIYSVDGGGGAVLLGSLTNNLRGSISAETPRRYYSRPGDVGLRFTFISDASLNNPGWVATVREASAPSVIGLLDISGDPFTVLGPGIIGVCSGSTNDFNAIASAPPATVTYKSFDRPSDSYTYTPVPANFDYNWSSTEPGSATTQVWQRNFATRNSFLLNVDIVTDKCRLLDTAVRVNVSTVPSFTGTSASQNVCEGSSVQITGVVTATSSTNFDNPPVNYTYTPTVTADRWDNTAGGFDGPSTGAVVRVPAPTTGPGTYTYTFVVSDDYGDLGCEYDTSITITVNPKVDAGLDATDSVCASSNAFDLKQYLGGAVVDNGSGRWIDFDNSMIPLDTVSGILDLQEANTLYGTSLPRTFRYVFKINGNPGCPADSAIVTLTIYPSAFAGNDASVTFCNNITPINLLSLVGTNQATGTWSTTFAGAGTITGNLLDPTTGGVLSNPNGYVGGGLYTYTYDISYPGTNAGCTDQSQVNIDFKETGVPGGDATIDICSSDNPVNLFTVLTGTPETNGVWTTPGGYVFTGVSPTLNFDPADPAQTNAPFTVTYTVSKNDPVCPDTSATVTVNFQRSPNSGTAVSPLTDVCTDAASFNLNTTLDGSQDASGTWTDNDGVSSLSGANNATVDLNTINFGAGDVVTVRYTYTVNATNTLCNTSSTDVFVRYTRKSNAGVTRTIAVCENSPIFLVRDSMAAPGPDPTVIYSGAPAGSLTPTDFGARFNPATTGLAGTTVVITATDTANGPGCADAVATLTIDISERPDAGTSTDSARVCITETVYEMADNLSATATTGGFWTVAGGSLPNPAWLDNDGTVNIDATGGNGFPGCGMKLTFEYHATSPNCNEVISTHTLDVKCGADAGDDDSVYVCSTDPIFALGAFVTTTDQSGRWQDLDGSGALSAVTTFPATFEPGRVNTTGEYRMAYVVDNNPCTPPDTAYITVFVSRLPRAGVGDTAAACEDETDFDLYTTLTGNFDREGRWELAMLPPYDANLNATVNGNRATYFKGAEESDFDVAAFMALINSSTSPFFATQPSSFPPFVRLKYTVQDTTNYGPNPPLCRDSVTFAILQISKLFNTPSPKSAVATEVCKTVSQFDLNSLV